MIDISTTLGSNFGIAGIVLLVIGLVGLYLGFFRFRNPFIQIGSALCLIASMVLLLVAFGHLDISWIADPQHHLNCWWAT